MSYQTFSQKMDVTAVDIHTMESMSLKDYKEYLEFGLLTVDHHDILRSEPAGYPLAVTKEQFSELLAYLKSLEHKIGT